MYSLSLQIHWPLAPSLLFESELKNSPQLLIHALLLPIPPSSLLPPSFRPFPHLFDPLLPLLALFILNRFFSNIQFTFPSLFPSRMALPSPFVFAPNGFPLFLLSLLPLCLAYSSPGFVYRCPASYAPYGFMSPYGITYCGMGSLFHYYICCDYNPSECCLQLEPWVIIAMVVIGVIGVLCCLGCCTVFLVARR